MSPKKKGTPASPPLYVIDGVRTPFVKSWREFNDIPAEELGRLVAREVLARTGVDRAAIDQVVFGCVGQNARAANIARVIALLSGVPQDIPAYTVHRNCASGMESIVQSLMLARLGRGDLFLVGGVESMSGYPLEFSRRGAAWFQRLARARSAGQKLAAAAALRPAMLRPVVTLKLGLTDPVCGLNMGETAEKLAREHGITRKAQDEFALASHIAAAAGADRLREEMMPVVTRDGVVRQDTGVRPDQTLEALERLRPVFDRRWGTVTAGNSSQITDGAAALLTATAAGVEASGLEPLGRIVDHATAACDPSRMGLGPAFAMARLLDRTGLELDDIDLIEINEAFAAQVLAVMDAAASVRWCREHLGRDALGTIRRERLNVNGGAVALGHPVGASGTRLVLTLLKELRRRGLKRGIATLCVGGGQGEAILVEV